MTKVKSAKSNLDWGWIFGILSLIVVLIVALIINYSYRRGGNDSNNISGSIKIDNGDLKINWERYQRYDVELSDTYIITNSGIYNMTGKIEDGAIIVKANKEAVIKIILNDVMIKNSNGPAIVCYSADDLVIELNGRNYLEDGDSYTTDWDEDIDSTIYAKSDLSFYGDGELILNANYSDGIVSKDDLTFRDGTYDVTSADDGIRGKDSVHIENGNFAIKSNADAIKSTNDTDTAKGFILIENGDFDIVAEGKGIKATNSILIKDGNFKITSEDDAIHSNNYVGIMDGDFEISSYDDGIHADARLTIDGGTINIANSYEGLEAQKISINSGKISIFANDDGMNAGGGVDDSAKNRPGGGPFDADEDCEIAINGGDIYVNAAGDGVDSNGWLYINDGNVVVDGPTNNGNGALDAGAGIVQTGGSLLAVGASGMAEVPGSSSTIHNASIYLYATEEKGTKIEIKNSAGDTIISHLSAKSFNHIAVGTENFEKGQAYTLYIDNEKIESFTISDITTTVGNSPRNYQVMGPDPRKM